MRGKACRDMQVTAVRERLSYPFSGAVIGWGDRLDRSDTGTLRPIQIPLNDGEIK